MWKLIGAATLGAVLIMGPPASAQTIGVTQNISVQDSGTKCATAGTCATFTIPPAISSVTLSVTGSGMGTVTFQAQGLFGNWFDVEAIKSSTGVAATTATSTGLYSINNAGMSALRVVGTTVSSGVFTVAASGGSGSARSPNGTGTGDVAGPGSATDNAVARFDGSTGKAIQNSTAILADDGSLALTGDNGLSLKKLGGSTVIIKADTTDGALNISIPTGGGYLYGDTDGTWQFGDSVGSAAVWAGQYSAGFVGPYALSTIGHTIAYNAPSTSAADVRLNTFQTEYVSTGGSATDVTTGMRIQTTIGTNNEATIGAFQNIGTVVQIRGSGSAANEYSLFSGTETAQIGTGFTQTAGPIGNMWMGDFSMFSGINIQPTLFGGWTVTGSNYYNGSPSTASSYLFAAVTFPNIGAGNDATHQAATMYPMDDGFIVVGKTGTVASPSTIGFTKAFRCGGSGSNWAIAASFIGTCMDMSQFSVRGIYIHDPTGTPTAAIEATAGAIIFGDLKTTGAAASKKVVCVDTSTGKLYASSTGVDCSN